MFSDSCPFPLGSLQDGRRDAGRHLAPIVHSLLWQYLAGECVVFFIARSVPSDTLVMPPTLALAGTANLLFQLTACLYLAE